MFDQYLQTNSDKYNSSKYFYIKMKASAEMYPYFHPDKGEKETDTTDNGDSSKNKWRIGH